MSQINIKILKQGTIHPNIISCSFFTMKDSYRKFEKYKSNLKKFLIQCKTLNNFEIRIYVDNTSGDLSFINDSNVSIYHFDCPEFRDGDGHLGTFGTFVRFLPLFENHSLVWISDIDVPDHYFNISGSYDFRIVSNICYERKVYGRKYTILAGRFVSKHQLPKSLLTRFLNKILDNSFSNEIQKLNSENKKPPSKFPYGMDELFLNKSIYDYIKKRDYKVLTIIDMFVSSMLIYNTELSKSSQTLLLDYYETPNKKMIPKILDLYHKYIPLILNKYPCLQKVLDIEFKNSFEIKELISSTQM
jgi:hypothetical protein